MKVKAVVDIHEPTELYDAVAEHPDVDGDPLVTVLDAADISIGGIGFERKTWNDLASSMQEGRLDEQMEKLGAYEESYVLIDGSFPEAGDQHGGMSREALLGMCASITARDNHPVNAAIPCSNNFELADHAVRLARKHSEDPTSTYLPTGSVGVDEPAGKQMWGCFEGVGPELAERLYDKFGSPAVCGFAILKDERLVSKLMEVDGIGEKLAVSIVNQV